MNATLLVVLRERATLYLLPAATDEDDILGSTVFRARDQDHLAGFYDWLWSSESLVGVRFWPVRVEEGFLDAVAAHKDVKIDECNGCFDLWFCRPPPDGVGSSEDQDFGGQVARDAAGVIAMTFDLQWFEPGAMAALQRDSRATWGDPADVTHL